MMRLLRLDVGDGADAFSVMRGESGEFDTEKPYAGFNVCHYTGDNPEHIIQCRKELASYLEIDTGNLLIPRQTHSTNVAVIGDSIPELEETDAMVTCRKDVALVINTADCLPIVFNDSINDVIGIAHGGWRGLYDGIIENTVAAMQQIGATPSTINAAIGPCICADCYEVSSDFAERFATRFPTAVHYPTTNEVIKTGDTTTSGQPHVDLREVAHQLLLSCGIYEDNILISMECTRCNPLLFSARRLTVNSSRTPTIVKLNH